MGFKVRTNHVSNEVSVEEFNYICAPQLLKKKKASHIWTIWGNNNLSDSLFKRTQVSIRIKRQYLTREKGKIIIFLFLLHFPSPVNKTFSLIPTLPFSAQRTLRTIQYWESLKETYYSMPFFFPGHLKADYSAFQNIPNTFFFLSAAAYNVYQKL